MTPERRAELDYLWEDESDGEVVRMFEEPKNTNTATELWAYIDDQGRILADSSFRDEFDAWRAALGWPTVGEVNAAKARGCRVVRVKVEEVSE